ncbi:LacI family transcriptional regulator [Glaciihabitans sp. INWT7]|uniref:LacI family DNA-binding transcriptional regulator n=1 Tax=Glaciihabitans sp. INWT7 TaxID=2596912 RepID=UPI0016251C3C|nr:LacI family DNA-binding transcriptional regulator [Glaciihabitans sp. INWT7]QNE45538.1 LacI family transcriptional regulator [Glaciihabitans sp. INWT7]
MDDTATPARARPNLASVAALAGVSPSTASLAFSGSGPVSDATRERVLAAAAELDYAGPDPRAQSLRRGRSGIIGVVIEDRLRDAFRDPMNVAMLDGIADETGSLGAGLLLLTENGEGAASIRNAPVDAVVLIGCSTSLAGQVAIFRQRGIALVAIEAEPMDDVLAIDLDNREGSQTLARHLSDLGHSRVALVTLPLDAARSRGPLTEAAIGASTGYTALERIRGVRGVFPNAPGVMAAASSIEEGLAAGLALLSEAGNRPTAVIAQSDLLAVGVIRAAEQLGIRVPQDLSIVGFDGVKLDGIAPYDLTTMVQPAVEKGRAAGRGVIALLNGEHPQPVSFVSRFHPGTTTAPPSPQ